MEFVKDTVILDIKPFFMVFGQISSFISRISSRISGWPDNRNPVELNKGYKRKNNIDNSGTKMNYKIKINK